MANFSYSVRAAGGRVTTGNLMAESRVDALNTLRNKGLFVLDLLEQEGETSIDRAGFGGGFFQRVKLQEQAVFFRQFAAMVDAGIPLTRCLITLAKQQRNAYFGKLLLAVKNDVAAGLQPSAAMAKFPRVFNPMVISMLVSAEETGTLDKTLDQLAEAFEAEVNLRHQISAGMRYPQIVSVAALLVVVFVMVFVVPQFQEIFRSMGATLPLMTQIVVNTAVFLKRFWWLLLVLFIFMPLILNAINGTTTGRLILDTIKLKVPVFGDLTRKIILARVSRVFSTLLYAGVPIIKTLTIVEQTSLNVVYEKAWQHVRNAVKEGRNVSGVLETYPGLFPPLVTAMVAVGEESGTLDNMLQKVNDFYMVEIDTMVKKLTALIEPVLIICLGTVIGFIVVALWMPLFKVIQLIQEMR